MDNELKILINFQLFQVYMTSMRNDEANYCNYGDFYKLRVMHATHGAR